MFLVLLWNLDNLVVYLDIAHNHNLFSHADSSTLNVIKDCWINIKILFWVANFYEGVCMNLWLNDYIILRIIFVYSSWNICLVIYRCIWWSPGWLCFHADIQLDLPSCILVIRLVHLLSVKHNLFDFRHHWFGLLTTNLYVQNFCLK